MLEILKKLTELGGISGREETVREYIISQIQGHCEEIKTDNLGNLIVFKRGSERPKNKVMLDAHMDEVGFIVRMITPEGFIKVTPVGGIDPRVIVGRTLLVGSQRIPAVTGVKPVHLLSKDETKKAVDTDDIYLDIGAASRQEAQEYVHIGDEAVFDSEFVEFGDGYIKAKALDDRAGCAVLIKIIQGELKYDTYFTFSTQEEVGLRGAACAAFGVQPDYAIIVETTTAADIIGVEPDKQVCKTGEGAVVSFMDRGTLYSKFMFDKALSVAKENSIESQVKTVIAGSNNSGAIHLSGKGVKTMTLSVPCRYLHSSSCVIKYSDLESIYALSKELSQELAND